MQQFVPIDDNVEVLGQAVLTIVKEMGPMKSLGMQYLRENGIEDPKPDQWYSQKSWLDAFKRVSEKIGARTLRAIGKGIPDNALFPDDIDTLEKALAAIDIAYHINHRGGEIGYYKYTRINDHKAIMECRNPYPTEFDHGIIEAMALRFKPEDSLRIKVYLDESKATRKNGGDSDTFIIEW